MTQTATEIVVVSTESALMEMLRSIDLDQPVYLDTETTGYEGSDLRTDRPVSLQFHQGEHTWIVDVRPCVAAGLRHIGRRIQHYLSSALFVGHNIKFDLEVLLIHFGYLHLRVWDTMIAEQVIYGLGLSDGRSKGVGFGLKDCSERRGLVVEKDTRGSFKNMHLTPEWNRPFSNEQVHYMAQDVQVLPSIYLSQLNFLEQNYLEGGRLWECYELEQKVTPALAHIETGGLGVDWGGWMAVIEEKAAEAEQLKEEVTLVLGKAIQEARDRGDQEQWEKYWGWEAARDKELARLKDQYAFNLFKAEGEYESPAGSWGEFKNENMKAWRERNPNPGKPSSKPFIPNIGSQQQLMLAFAELNIPAKDTTEGTLEDLAEDYPVVAQLTRYRKAVKFVQSFGETLKAKVSAADGRLHPDFIQIGASSNRMSCKNPNFQQIPSKGDGQRLRKCVAARPGFKILTADFGSQELAIIADLSGDETMLRFFAEGVDLHSATARMMFGLSEDVDPKKFEIVQGVSARTAAKTINYGLAYGLSAYGLAFQLGISPSSAEELIERWYKPYAGVRRYFDERKKQVFRGPLYAETQHGWRRHFDPLPAEPRKPFYNRACSSEQNKQALADWKALHRSWEKQKRRLENKLMNTPVQGTGAGITKKALADFFEVVCLYNANAVQVQILAVVHDELVVEVQEDRAEEVAAELARCMDGAMRYYLHTVKFPASDVHIADCWSK